MVSTMRLKPIAKNSVGGKTSPRPLITIARRRDLGTAEATEPSFVGVFFISFLAPWFCSLARKNHAF